MRVLVTGGAGFVGSHLCDALILRGDEVLCVDSLVTGRESNVQHLLGHENFGFWQVDCSTMTDHFLINPVDAIAHLASPASPPHYQALPVTTLEAGSKGTLAALEIASTCGARFLLASTSEVYGNPEVHPQPEWYWGRVNPVGPRAMYDESKRFAEAAATTFADSWGVDVRIARIFNTIGERMRPDDGRAVPTFISQALRGEPLTVHGDGMQTRSVGYVGDLVDGLIRLLDSDVEGPVNIGNPEEHSVECIARRSARAAGVDDPVIEFVGRPGDDPDIRCPDITRARELLGWNPTTSLDEALERTASSIRRELEC